MKDLKPYGGKVPTFAQLKKVAQQSLNTLKAECYEFEGRLRGDSITLYSESFHNKKGLDIEFQLSAILNKEKNTFSILFFDHDKFVNFKKWPEEALEILYFLRRPHVAESYFQYEIQRHIRSGETMEKYINDTFSVWAAGE